MRFGMVREDWNQLRSRAKDIPNLPVWVASVFNMSFDAVAEMVEGGLKREGLEVYAETREVSDTYLDFLREQIELGTRGPEWANILQTRLDALQHYIGVPLWTVAIYNTCGSFYLRIDPRSLDIVHWELL